MAENKLYFFQILINNFICDKVSVKLQQDIPKSSSVTWKSYLKILILALILLVANQGLYLLSKSPNLFSRYSLSRKYNALQIKMKFAQLNLQLMKQKNITKEERIALLYEYKEAESILTHPARRLMYDTFNNSQASSAWGFKSQQYIMSQILSTSVFYAVYTVVILISRLGSEKSKKNSIKIDLIIQVLLFLIEIDLIINVEKRFSQHSDIIDQFYSALTIFERRTLLHYLVMPLTKIVQYFVVYCVRSSSELKLLALANNLFAKTNTLKIKEKLIQSNLDNEESFALCYDQNKNTLHLESNVFRLQRDIIKKIIDLEGDNILLRKDINNLCAYYHIALAKKER